MGDFHYEPRDAGLGVVFISHTLPHIFATADRTVVLGLGQVAADAPTVGSAHNSLLKVITGLK